MAQPKVIATIRHKQPAIEGYRVTMVQIFVTSNLSIQISSIDTRDER